MNTVLKDILALPDLGECSLLHQEATCDRIVKSLTVMDNPEILNWMSEYEILLSNGSSLVDLNILEWKAFFDGLLEKKAAALFIKLSYFIKSFPTEVVDYIKEIDFPVVVVPNSYPWVKITDPIHRFMIEQQFYCMTESLSLRDTLNNILIHGGGIDDLCQVASRDMGCNVAVFSDNWDVVGQDQEGIWDEVSYLMKKRNSHFSEYLDLETQKKYPYHVLDACDRKIIFIKLPCQSGKRYSAFCLKELSGGIGALEAFKIEQINIALMLCTQKEVELSRLERHYYVNFLFDLMDGILVDGEEIREKAQRLGRRMHGAYQLIIFDLGKNAPENAVDSLIQGFGHEPEFSIRDIMCCERDAKMVLFHPVLLKEDRLSIEKVYEKVFSRLGIESTSFGVSRPYAVEKSHQAYYEALFSHSMGKIIPHSIIYYEDLKLMRLFEENSHKANISFMLEYYEDTLSALVAYDLENDSHLIETLVVFLGEDRSVARTAAAMYLHENTLRSRIKRIETITGRSLKSSIDIAKLTIAIQIHTFLKK